jgi:hypothetical protein
MVNNSPSIILVKISFELLSNVNLLIICLLPMLEEIHALIKFVQKKDVFIVIMLQPSKIAKSSCVFIIQM